MPRTPLRDLTGLKEKTGTSIIQGLLTNGLQQRHKLDTETKLNAGQRDQLKMRVYSIPDTEKSRSTGNVHPGKPESI